MTPTYWTVRLVGQEALAAKGLKASNVGLYHSGDPEEPVSSLYSATGIQGLIFTATELTYSDYQIAAAGSFGQLALGAFILTSYGAVVSQLIVPLAGRAGSIWEWNLDTGGLRLVTAPAPTPPAPAPAPAPAAAPSRWRTIVPIAGLTVGLMALISRSKRR